MSYCFIVAGAIFISVVFTDLFGPFVDVQNIPCLLDWCRLSVLGLLGYLPLRFDSPQLLNHQPPAAKEHFYYRRLPPAFPDMKTSRQFACVVGQWSRFTWELFSTVNVCSEVVVSVCCGEGKTRGASRHYFLLISRWRLLLQVESELLLLSVKLEVILSRLLLLLSGLTRDQLNLQDVLALFGQRVDVLQAQPKLAWGMTKIQISFWHWGLVMQIFKELFQLFVCTHHSGCRSLSYRFPTVDWSSGIHHDVSGWRSIHLLQREKGLS